MKRIFHKLPLYILATLTLQSCAKLDQEPYGILTDTSAFLNPEDAQYWVNGMYDGLRQNTYGDAMYSSDVQADFLNAVHTDLEVLPQLHRWASFTSSNEKVASIWQSYFKAIHNINIAINGLPTIPTKTEQERDKVAKNLGELYLGRAYYYSYLLTHYCGAYDEASPYGLPILKEPKVSDLPAPSSLKATYDFVLEDIAKAELLLANTSGTEGATTFTRDAAKALKARVLLYKGDWQAAYDTAQALIATNTYPLATSTSVSSLRAMWAEDTPTESITQLFAAPPAGTGLSELPKANNIYIKATFDYRTRRFSYKPNYIPTKAFLNLYQNTDYRKQVYFQKYSITYGGTTFRDIYFVNKYPDNNNLKTNFSGLPTYMHKPKLFRIAEQYLIAAEAAYRKGDEGSAKSYLNSLRRSRNLTTDVTATGEALFTEIQNERNRELAFEGFRLHDIKRWGLGVVRGTPQNPDAIISTPPEEYYQLNIPAGNYKLTWPIPAANITFENGRWRQNPGW